MTVQPMSAAQLTRKVIDKEPLFILDVRNEREFADWKVEGENFQILNKPYFELLEGVDSVAHQLPQEEDILVVCAKEGSAKYVAERLCDAGFKRLSYLQGGMKAWSEHLEPVKIGELSGGGSIYQFVRLGKGCLSYVIEADGEAAVVDANRMVDAYTQFAKDNGLSIRHIIDTHVHADHISGGRRLAKQTGALYWLPPKDAEEVTFDYRPLVDGTSIALGGGKVEIKAVHTPGHTIGSTSLIVDGKYLLTGDLLFVASIGRPDLAGKAKEWVDDLRHTLYETYRQLPGHLVVLPAHFSDMRELNPNGSVQEKLGELYRHNKGLRIESDDEFRVTVTENLPPRPNAYQEIRQVNMGKLHPNADEQSEMEIGPNHCAVHE